MTVCVKLINPKHKQSPHRHRTVNIMKSNQIKPLLLLTTLSLAGCASQGELPLIKAPIAEHKPALSIIIQRDQRLPAEFTRLFSQLSQQALPDFNLKITEGITTDNELAQADWVMTLRATRITPNYTFKPADSSVLNAVNDSIWGSGLGVGLFVAPTIIYGDEDFMEATLRNAQGITLKTYQQTATEAGFFWTLIPSAYVANLDENQRWQEQIISLYQKMADDKVLESAEH